MKKMIILIIVLLFLSIFYLLFNFNLVKAQDDPFILITLRGLNYAPLSYKGKIVPIQSSPVIASVALIQNGKFIDTSNMQINWLIDQQPYQSGTGLSTIIFQEPDLGTRFASTYVEADFPNYPSGLILNSMYFNPILPKVVIENRYPNNQFSGQNINLKALPYFFNIKSIQDLNINWLVNGQSPADASNPGYLNIKTPNNLFSGFQVNISLTIQSKINQFEGAQSQESLTYAK